MPLLASLALLLLQPAAAGADVVVDAGGGMALGRHSEQLMGVTAYGSPDFDEPRAQQLVRELGIRSIGVQAVVTRFAPPNLSVAALAKWFAPDDPESGSSPALRYVNATWNSTALLRVLASNGIRAAGAEPWIFLKTGDGKPCEGTAAEGHCFAAAGTPRPDANGDWSWWSTLFVGVFSVLHRLDPSLRYVHLWNEPNAHFWLDKFPNGTRISGSYYSEFYRPVATALAATFPPRINGQGQPDLKTGIVLGGPVTYNPPFQYQERVGGRITEETWIEWFEPLLHATAAANKQLLEWVDFHAYNGAPGGQAGGGGGKGECTGPNCHNAAAETIEMNLQQIALVGQAMGRPGLVMGASRNALSLAAVSVCPDRLVPL
jgi:hypothetical protein